MSFRDKYLEQIVGGFIALALSFFLVFLLYSASGGGWFTPKNRYKLVLEEGIGLDPGVAVTISGMEIGEVESVTLTSSRHVELVLAVDRAYADHIHEDSVGNATMSLGGKVVTIDDGTPGSEPLPDGGTLRTGANFDVFLALERMDLVGNLQRLESILEDINDLAEQIHVGDGRLPETIEGLLVLIEDMQAGKGTIGRLLKDDDVLDEVMQTVEEVDKMAKAVESASAEISVMTTDIKPATGSIVNMAGDVGTATDKLASTAANFDTVAQNLSASLGNLNASLAELGKTMKAIQRLPLIKGAVKKDEKDEAEGRGQD